MNEETKKFAELYISCCTDFLLGKIEEDHYKNMMKLFNDKLNEVAIPITQRTYSEQDLLESGKVVSMEEYNHAIEEIGQLHEQLKEANEYIRDLQKGYEH